MAQSAAPKNIVIASANGLQSCAKAMEIIKSGGDTLDAVVAGVNIVELDPNDDSVGYGGLPNEEGVVELDASVMHGPTRRAGSVASIRNIKLPSKVAKLVMEQTDHVMIVGDGALRFAKAWGFQEENLLTEKSRLAWMVWKQSLRDARGHNNWTDGVDAPPWNQAHLALKQDVPRRRRSHPRLGVGPRREPAHRHHQLPRAEREGRDVRRHHHQRTRLEDSRPRRRLAHHRRGSLR
jgi:hypothetical protein